MAETEIKSINGKPIADTTARQNKADKAGWGANKYIGTDANGNLVEKEAPQTGTGTPGADGFSPVVSVETITGGHRITITDKDGTKTVDVMDGEDGDPGEPGSPGDPGRGIASITRTSGTGAAGTTDTYTITYTDGTTSTFDVYNGKDGDPYTLTSADKTAIAQEAAGLVNVPAVDDTLKVSGAAADAAKVGTELSNLSGAIADKLAKNHGAENVGKILVVGTDGNLTLIDMPEGGTGGDVVGVLDDSNNIILSGTLADGTYTLKYVMDDGTYTDVGTLTVNAIVNYTVTQNLTNVTSDNAATSVRSGESLSVTLTPFEGYAVSAITVTMGGTDITSSAVSGGTISIAEVTGDIVITAVAEEAVEEVTNWIANSQNADGTLFVGTNGEAGYKPNTRLGTSDGGERTQSGVECTGFIPVTINDTLYFKGVTTTTSSNETTCFYDSSHALISGGGASTNAMFGTMSGEVKAVKISDIKSGAPANNPDKIAYVRISANTIDANSIITKNQPIE